DHRSGRFPAELRWSDDVAPFVSGGQCASCPTLARSVVASSTDRRMSICHESRALVLMYGLMDTRLMMDEESTTPDLVELTRQAIDAMTRGDLDAAISYAAPDVVFDAPRHGVGTF